MLRAAPELVEVLASLSFLQDLKALCAKLRHAGVATQVVVLAITHHGCAATGAFPRLLPHLRWINELGEESSLLRPGLRLVNVVHLLVPASNLLIVEEAALAGGEVVVASDGLAAAPAEVDLAVRATDLAATVCLLDAHVALGAVLGGLGQVPQRQELGPCRRSLTALACRPGFQGFHAVVCRGAGGAWVIGRAALAAEGKATDLAAGHVVFVLDAGHAVPTTLKVAARAVHHILHGIDAVLQAELLVLLQQLRVRAQQLPQHPHVEALPTVRHGAPQSRHVCLRGVQGCHLLQAVPASKVAAG
mmetsp:Transcript_79255/g.190207  ORF Transcript_79255/g.190207 Transcript_79255/m.190207 type:complete len:304 (-) Transcript_79255:696-1607(-)|eukprot:CAMPEP_0181491228 /NCGR_PEP_ID=MMETSP1110-20121109/50000_1 /TAXON_ID=174948 /ORGANISM="Symbiodinium sp., Strain CCMP421" /LENGTH=303 /DNA_ID=CAMNT_0023618307 /DNA_START=15 /DNA_END=926 /DNA_ORIENTATION=-